MDMNWKKIAMAFLLAAGLPAAQNALAQTTYEEMEQDRKSTRLNSSHWLRSRMPSSA